MAITHISLQAENFKRLGKEIKISPKTKVSINKAGGSIDFEAACADILINIGSNHTAHLIMTTEALESLQNGAEINVDTLKEFKKQLK